MKKKVKKKRYDFKHTRWANDSDYLERLPEAERAWMEKFLDEYYNGKIKKGDPKAFNKGVIQCPKCKGKRFEMIRGVKVDCQTCRVADKSLGFIDRRKEIYRRKNVSELDVLSFKGAIGQVVKLNEDEN